MSYSVRRINTLAKKIGAERYLEIGVSQGETFRQIEIQHRTAVDPQFQFVPDEIATPFTRFEQTTSDLFFDSEPLEPTYDIIFIDGLHHFEQVVRDFSNSLLRMHRRSIMLIDDTIPNDVYSAEPDEAKCGRYRRAGGGPPNDAWHGDVFKVLFYIHDFWPSLNFRTIMGSGNPQTLVWQTHRTFRRPIFNNLERISRLTYFELQEYKLGAKFASEEEAIDLCVLEIGAQ